MIHTRRVTVNIKPIPENTKNNLETQNQKKKFQETRAYKIFSVAAISAGRSQRGNKQYFNLGLIFWFYKYHFEARCILYFWNFLFPRKPVYVNHFNATTDFNLCIEKPHYVPKWVLYCNNE